MSLKTGMSASLSSPANLPPQSLARCRHFGVCGGCSSQVAPYPDELREKFERLKVAFKPLGLEPSVIHPSPDIWFYRNKMEFSFGGGSGASLSLGLKAKGKWYQVLSLEECFLLSPETPALLKSVSDWAVKEGLSAYDARSHSGILRHLVVREAKNGKDRLVLLVTAGWQLPEESFVKAVLDSYPATTILRGTNDKLTDTAIPDSQEVLFGSGWINETLHGEGRSPADSGSGTSSGYPSVGRSLDFRVSPQSFFQSNTRGSEILHSFLRDKIRALSPKVVLDLYCGLGAITLSVADLCEKVIGLECVDAAIVDANFNARANGILNASFYCGLTEILLPALLAMKPDLLIMDPPRSGVHPRALDILSKAEVPAILYVSCNPKTLVRDLEILLSRYEVKSFEAFDFFPHTEHVETAALLIRR